jgi:hypothetical protein
MAGADLVALADRLVADLARATGRTESVILLTYGLPVQGDDLDTTATRLSFLLQQESSGQGPVDLSG